MIKRKSFKFSTYLLLVVFIITSAQCVSTISHNTLHKISSIATLAKTSIKNVEAPHFYPSSPSPQKNISLAMEEELEENEEINEKHLLPVLTFADISQILSFKEVQNYHSIFLHTFSSLISSVPLHIVNCVYLI